MNDTPTESQRHTVDIISAEAGDLSDEAIASLVQNGDSEKFGILMERYDNKLSRYGKKFLARSEHIEDIVQDTFINAYQNINNFDTSLKFSSWIYRIAHNGFVNGLRKAQRSALPNFDLDIFLAHYVTEDPATVEREDAERITEMQNMIEHGLEQLKPKYREVLVLHYIEGLGYKEIADVLQVPIGTVGIRVKRAKETLKKFYQKNSIVYEL
jgi:RNA polymerase sigma-70 factor (ECF subfamily)